MASILLRVLIVTLLLVGTIKLFAQYQAGYLPEFFFGRQPNAHAEAMGRSYTSFEGGLGSIYFNPAGIANIKQIEINTSITPPEYYSTKGYYTFYGIGFKMNKYLEIAFSQFQFNFGKTQVVNANTVPYTKNNTLTVSSEPIKDLLIGLNTNYFVWQPGIDKISNTLSFDLGVIKKFSISSKYPNQKIFSIGASITNANYSTTSATFNNINEKYFLPVITKYNVSYASSFSKTFLFDSVSLVKMIVQSEYQALLNSPYRSAIRFGGEVIFLNLVSTRFGWYKEKVYDFGFPNENKDYIAAFTYGVGVHIPVYSLLKLPIDIQFDFTSLPQVSYSKINNNWNSFTTFTLNLKYITLSP